MQKKQNENIFDLCSDAYKNDLNKDNFDTPLMYIDKEGMKIKIEKIKDIMKMEREKEVEKKRFKNN